METNPKGMQWGVRVFAATSVALLAAGGGYWAGQHASGASAPQVAAAAVAPAKPERKLLYYRNPMGLPDTSPTPKKDPMGMDYIAVYAGAEDESPEAASQIRLSTEKVQKLGVKTEPARRQTLDRIVRAMARIEPDERRTYTIAPKFEGYIERLHVSVTGQKVAKGQPLFEVYSPELISAQREYAIAAQGVQSLGEGGGSSGEARSETLRGMQQLADASLARLRNWDVPIAQVNTLAKTGASRRTLTFRSPVGGIVTEKKAIQGMRFMPGEALYQIADLSSVWAIADVSEQDIGLLSDAGNDKRNEKHNSSAHAALKAKIRIDAYPDRLFEGVVTYIYPTLTTATRTVPVRVELANPAGLLKPGMFAQVELPVVSRGAVIAIPISAVIDSGTRQIVLVQVGDGRYEPREVKLGVRNDRHVEVLEGVKDGESVVVTANFLIDAESNLKAALDSLGHAAHGSGKDAPPANAGPGHQAAGKIEEIDAKAGTVSISHGPVASLHWPAMTMEFKAAHTALLKGLQPGAQVAFEFVERGQGEWVITTMTSSPQPAASAHADH